jgi:hypothetical protein
MQATASKAARASGTKRLHSFAVGRAPNRTFRCALPSEGTFCRRLGGNTQHQFHALDGCARRPLTEVVEAGDE